MFSLLRQLLELREELVTLQQEKAQVAKRAQEEPYLKI